MIAKNNIFNIRSGYSRWKGQTESRKGFCCFDSISNCVRAALKLLLVNYPKHGANTIAQCIRRWAPPEDHNDTEAYISYVCKGGLEPDQIVAEMKKAELFLLLEKMAKMETGWPLNAKDFNAGFEAVYNR